MMRDRVARPASIRRTVVTATLVGCAALAGACDKDSILAPNGSELTLVVTSSTLPANGSIDVTAHLFRGGFATGGETGATAIVPGVGPPVRDDTIVTFVSTLGRVEPTQAKTFDGKVTVQLFGDGRAGTAKLTAFSGPATSTIDITITAVTETGR
jgi:hypothetical protein